MAIIEFDIPAAKSVLDVINGAINSDLDVYENLKRICDGMDSTWESHSAREFQDSISIQLIQWGCRLNEILGIRKTLEDEILKWEQVARKLGP